MKRLIYAGALALALTCAAGSASANSELVTNVTMDTSPPIVHVNDGTVNEDVYMGPMEFTVQGMLDPVLVWCIDLDHNIGLGQSYNYTTESLLDYLGGSFDLTVWTEIAGLVKAGSLLPHGSGMNIFQGAIWDNLVPNVVSTGDITLLGQVNGLAATSYSAQLSDFTVWLPVEGGQIMLQHNTGGVPEPATWALLTLGFGGMGAMLRRRRSLAFA